MSDQRTLDSFDDAIIVHTKRRGDGLWSSVLDCGFLDQASDPDFAPWGTRATREQSIASCAGRIRESTRGLGKYAPYSLLLPGYDLHYRLMPHWEKKERCRDCGSDPNEVMTAARKFVADEGFWNVGGNFLARIKRARHMEFSFRVELAVAQHEIQEGRMDHETALHSVLEAMVLEGESHLIGLGESQDMMRARIEAALLEVPLATTIVPNCAGRARGLSARLQEIAQARQPEQPEQGFGPC